MPAKPTLARRLSRHSKRLSDRRPRDAEGDQPVDLIVDGILSLPLSVDQIGQHGRGYRSGDREVIATRIDAGWKQRRRS